MVSDRKLADFELIVVKENNKPRSFLFNSFEVLQAWSEYYKSEAWNTEIINII